MKKILLVEDESSVISFVTKGLGEQGYEVSVALDGGHGAELALSYPFDLIILDIMLPGKNGLEVCKEIRKKNRNVPILILTALGTAENVVVGLEQGADDYLVKPFKFIELTARIKSLLRRTEPSAVSSPVTPFEYRFADLEINDVTKTVIRAGAVITFTSTEYRLLLLFVKNPRKVFSRMEILEDVWGINFDMNTNVVDVYVNYLRKKLEINKQARLIHTVIGMGYVMKQE
jgi:two-component system copper resistance phosphate regulon response regulator CusR